MNNEGMPSDWRGMTWRDFTDPLSPPLFWLCAALSAFVIFFG
jgi:hypothetical protein